MQSAVPLSDALDGSFKPLLRDSNAMIWRGRRGAGSAAASVLSVLLAKTPEDRYQTAAGLERDLRRCLAEWEAQGRTGEFPPGGNDTADRLLIPGKLYGRARDADAACRFRTHDENRRAPARARLGLFRHRQILRRERAAQGARSAARPFRFVPDRLCRTGKPRFNLEPLAVPAR
jgi:hypothetical protein